MKAFLAALVLACPVAAWAQSAIVQDSTEYARVIAVSPVAGSQVARQVCRPVTITSPTEDHSLLGSVIGGVTGAVVGSRFGSGHGRDLATVAGAVGGTLVGNRMGAAGSSPTPREQCETVYEPGPVSGYAVTYEYQGRQGHVTLNRDPGNSLRLRKRVTVE